MFTYESIEGNLMSLFDGKKDGIHVYTEQYIDSYSIQNKSSYIIIPKSNINIITKPCYNKKNTKYLVASIGILIFLISKQVHNNLPTLFFILFEMPFLSIHKSY